MHFLGFNVMPRRMPDFPDSFHSWWSVTTCFYFDFLSLIHGWYASVSWVFLVSLFLYFEEDSVFFFIIFFYFIFFCVSLGSNFWFTILLFFIRILLIRKWSLVMVVLVLGHRSRRMATHVSWGLSSCPPSAIDDLISFPTRKIIHDHQGRTQHKMARS